MAEVIDRVELSGIVMVRDAILKMEKPYAWKAASRASTCPSTSKKRWSAPCTTTRPTMSPRRASRNSQGDLAKCPHRQRHPGGEPAETIVTNGGMHGLYCLFRALLEPGDEVLIPDPTWTCVQHLITLCGGVVERVPLHEERGWTFDPAEYGRRSPRAPAP